MSRVAAIVLLSLPALGATAGMDAVERTLAKMDQSAATFKAMTANIRNLTHTAVINEDNIDTGKVFLKRSKREMQVLVELTAPDQKSVSVRGRKVEVYYPKINTVQEYDLGNKQDLVEQFLFLGWGTSGKELASSYTIKGAGEQVVSGEKTARLELIPKSKQVLQQLKKLELWISEANGYPVQQKFYRTGGDYNLVTYTDLKINPDLPDSALKLKLPKGVKREYPQK